MKVREHGNAIKQYVYRRDKEASPPAPPRRGRGVKCLGNRKQIEYNWRIYHSPPSSGRGWGRGFFMASMTPFLSSCCATSFTMHCILTQVTVWFESSYIVICTKLRGNLMQFGSSFDANCMDFQRGDRTLFECNFITTWLSAVYKILKMRRIWDKSAPSVWIYKPNESNCKVLWKDLTYFLLIGISERHRHEMKDYATLMALLSYGILQTG